MQNQSERIEKPTVVILAAGKSTRMGSPKFMLDFNSNRTFLEKIVEDYRDFGCTEITIVLNQEGIKILNKTKSKIIDYEQIAINPCPEKERLFSIQTGLLSLKNTGKVFIHPVDNPFVNHQVLQLLLENSKNGDYQIPTFKGKGGHPILISSKIINAICNLKDLNLNLKIFLGMYKPCKIDVDEIDVLCNINEKEDYINFARKE